MEISMQCLFVCYEEFSHTAQKGRYHLPFWTVWKVLQHYRIKRSGKL